MDKEGNKTGGRKAGTRNKSTKDIVETIATGVAAVKQLKTDTRAILREMPSEFGPAVIQWLGNHWLAESFLDDWRKLKPADRFSVFDKFYQYCVAKKSASQSELSLAGPTTAEEDLAALAEEIPTSPPPSTTSPRKKQ